MTKLRSVNVTGRPIQSWPGDLTKYRTESRFKASWSSTLDMLDRELYHLSAKNTVLQLAMREGDFGLDGAPKANARSEHPGVILSLDSPYGPLSYPCDRFTNWQDNLRAIVLALEALRKVDRYGVTKNGEQYKGWKQLDGRPMTAPMDRSKAAEYLANAADPNVRIPGLVTALFDGRMIEATYKTAAKNLHPDTGGTTEDFQRLQEAKRLLDGAA